MIHLVKSVQIDIPDRAKIDKEKARFRDDPKVIESIARKYVEILKKHEPVKENFLAVLNYICEPNEAYRKKKPDPLNFHGIANAYSKVILKVSEEYAMTVEFAIIHNLNHENINMFCFDDMRSEEARRFEVFDQNQRGGEAKFNEIKNRVLFIISLCGLNKA